MAARPGVPGAINAPIFNNDSAIRSDATRACICAAAAYLCAANIRSRGHHFYGAHDFLRVRRMDDPVVLTMKNDREDGFAVACPLDLEKLATFLLACRRSSARLMPRGQATLAAMCGRVHRATLFQRGKIVFLSLPVRLHDLPYAQPAGPASADRWLQSVAIFWGTTALRGINQQRPAS
jgi:hypothetical protein